MTSLISFLFRLVLVAAATFLFVVLFEHGPENYVENVTVDFHKLMNSAAGLVPAASKKSPDSGT
jgi:hypothetical protein